MDTYDRVMAAMEAGTTAPVAGRTMARRWTSRTADTYLNEVKNARDWWSAERVAARREAERAGLTGIPEGDVAQFMPWPPDRLARYTVHLVQQGTAPNTIRKALAALRAWHRLHGVPLPDGTAALTVLQEHEHILAEQGWAPRRAEPITLDTAVRLIATCDRRTDRGRRDAALLMLAFAGMLTTDALSWLSLRDVRIIPDGDALPEMLVRRRPDPVDGSRPARRPRLGRDRPQAEWVDVPHWRISGEHAAELCPVEAITAHHAGMVRLSDASSEPLFRPIDRYGNVSRERLQPGHMGAVLRRAADTAGLEGDDRPTMTELRLGGVVRRRLDGAPVDELEAVSGLSTLLEYVRAAEQRAAR